MQVRVQEVEQPGISAKSSLFADSIEDQKENLTLIVRKTIEFWDNYQQAIFEEKGGVFAKRSNTFTFHRMVKSVELLTDKIVDSATVA